MSFSGICFFPVTGAQLRDRSAICTPYEHTLSYRDLTAWTLFDGGVQRPAQVRHRVMAGNTGESRQAKYLPSKRCPPNKTFIWPVQSHPLKPSTYLPDDMSMPRLHALAYSRP